MTGGHHFWTGISSGTDLGKCEHVPEERQVKDRCEARAVGWVGGEKS